MEYIWVGVNYKKDNYTKKKKPAKPITWFIQAEILKYPNQLIRFVTKFFFFLFDGSTMNHTIQNPRILDPTKYIV